MKCEYITIGNREFLRAGDALIPVDNIDSIDFLAVDHAGSDCVGIYTPERAFNFYDNDAEVLKTFLTGRKNGN